MIEQEYHNNHFTAKDIERYHAGKMTPKEMHLLEKAALDDPFLADAVEGYIHAQTPEQDLQFLKGELSSRLSTTKVVALPKNKSSIQLWKVAALLILVAGLGWAVYDFSFNAKETDIALTTTDPSKQQESADTISSSNVATGQEEKPTASANTKSKKESATAMPKKRPSRQASEEKNTGEELMTRNNRIGYAPPNNNNGVASNAPASKEVADQNLDAASTSIASETDSPVANSITKPEARRDKEHVIVLQRAKDNNMPEVVLGKSRKDSLRKPIITFEEAEPQGGQSYYDDYVAQNLQLPETEKFKTTSREVQLSFDVNEAGQAVNIQVEKSLCKECDQEAIRLLKDGPKLVKKQKNKKKGRLSIRF